MPWSALWFFMTNIFQSSVIHLFFSNTPKPKLPFDAEFCALSSSGNIIGYLRKGKFLEQLISENDIFKILAYKCIWDYFQKFQVTFGCITTHSIAPTFLYKMNFTDLPQRCWIKRYSVINTFVSRQKPFLLKYVYRRGEQLIPKTNATIVFSMKFCIRARISYA